MIEDLAKFISKMQVKSPIAFLIAFAIITLLLAPGILNLVNNVEPSLEKILPQDIEEVKTMNDMRNDFGADMMYLIVYTKDEITDVRDPRVIRYIDILDQKLMTREGILSINTLADEIRGLNGGTLPTTYSEIKNLKTSNLFVNADYSLTIIQIRSDTGASARKITTVVDSIKEDINSLEDLNPGLEIEITGFNAIDKATFEIIMSDFAFIGLVSMILVAIVVFLTFRSLVRGMMPMIVVVNAILWTMGIAGYLNLTITVVSMVSTAMIMGLGIDFGIHVLHTYFEKRNHNSPKKSLEETQIELIRAMTGASLTTIAGFLALLFGVLPAMKTLAIILALGILNTLLGAVFLLPVIIYLYDTKFRKKS